MNASATKKKWERKIFYKIHNISSHNVYCSLFVVRCVVLLHITTSAKRFSFLFFFCFSYQSIFCYTLLSWNLPNNFMVASFFSFLHIPPFFMSAFVFVCRLCVCSLTSACLVLNNQQHHRYYHLWSKWLDAYLFKRETHLG